MIIPLQQANKLVKQDGSATTLFSLFLTQVADNGLVIGTGNPEGLLEAQQGRFYMDDAGVAGAVVFVKQLNDIAGDRGKGWVAV